jgi:hypothetical protein
VPGTNLHSEAHLTGRQRRRLGLARENGYLNAASGDHQKLLAAHTRWCWRLRIPVVWSERCSPHSRYGRVHLDLYTTSHRLTAAGQEELQSLALHAAISEAMHSHTAISHSSIPHAAVTPHDARWDRVPIRDLDRLAAAVFRASTRAANHQPDRAQPPELPARQPARLLSFDQSQAASA